LYKIIRHLNLDYLP